MPKAAWMLMAIVALALTGCGGGPTPTGPGTAANPATKPTPPQTQRPGTLFIAGGGADADGRLAPAFLGQVRARGEGPAQLFILPTASGVPAASGEAAAAEFRAIATRHTIGVVPLHADQPVHANNAEFTDQIYHADGLWFTGGDQSRITHVFRPTNYRPGLPGSVQGSPPETEGQPEAMRLPEGGSTTVDSALRAMLERGGTVGGTSAGAAAMSDPMIAGGRSEQALLVGTLGGGVEVAEGLGLYPAALIDQHFFERGRLGRLIAALEHTGGRYGLGIGEGKAVVVTLDEASTTTALGPDSALLVDMSQATRAGYDSRTGIRLSLLGEGDRWAGDSITPARVKERWAESQWPVNPEPLDPELGAWDPGAVRDAMHALAADPDTPQVLRSRSFTLTFTADQLTTFYIHPDDRRDLCAIGVRLDITRR